MPTAASHSGSDSALRATSLTRSSNSKSHDETSGDSNGTEKFPDFDHDASSSFVNGKLGGHGLNGAAVHSQMERWNPQKDSRVRWAAQPGAGQSGSTSHSGHVRQTSLSQALRLRSGSVSQNAQEIAGALRAPVSYKLIILCVMWYWSSALTNTSSKSILTAFDKPATLTLVQFALVSTYCILFSWLASAFPSLRTTVPALKHPIRYPSRDVVKETMPLAAFQIAGHLLSSSATSKMPVSVVHTIKGLSPLFTVLAYRFAYDIRYPQATYLSLIPLTVGVMLACAGKRGFKGETLGIIYSLLATLIFVTQNIFSKRLLNEAAQAEQQGRGAESRKPDKLNLLCYSSGLAFLFTCPIWFCSEGVDIVGDFLWDGSVDLNLAPNSFDHGRLALEFLFNGTFHFAQNILAFVLLSMVSPVTYSVASLLKRVFVIVIAIIWFQSPTTRLQAVGIGLTFMGLYLYDRSSEKNKADQRARTMTEGRVNGGQPLLPLNTKQPFAHSTNGDLFESPLPLPGGLGVPPPHAYTNGYALPNGEDTKKSDSLGARERQKGQSNATWLPPGTRQEDTWRMGETKIPSAA